MPAATDRLEFAPPPQPGTVRAFVLAILAHVLLMLALTWGISWNRESENMAAEAELWSSVPQQAAPPAATAPPVVQAPPLPTSPAPPPVAAKVEPAPPVSQPKPPDIALEQEKRKQEQAQRKQEELERQKKIEARKKQEERQKRELAERKAADEKKRQEEQVKAAKTKEEAKRVEAMRQENLRRMQGLAGATGRDDSTGTALRSSGPSVGYANRIAARIKPNIVFNDIISGNPSAEVEIRVAPDGTIVGRKLTKSSGVKSWDDAVLRAIDKTEVLPRDTDGTVVPQFPIHFRPHD